MNQKNKLGWDAPLRCVQNAGDDSWDIWSREHPAEGDATSTRIATGIRTNVEAAWICQTLNDALQPFKLVAFAGDRDRKNYTWRWRAVLSHDIGLKMTGCNREELTQEIFRFLSSRNINISPEGSGVPGAAYADEPVVDWYPEHVFVSQRGGLDV